jgi:hypothetical protein
MQIDINIFRMAFLFMAPLALGLVFPHPVHAEPYLSGTYICATVEVAGKVTPCSAPSLELNEDGSYQILSETGTYEIVSNRWLVLSSKQHGKARLVGARKIIFEYTSRGKKHRITYRRKFERPEGWISA